MRRLRTCRTIAVISTVLIGFASIANGQRNENRDNQDRQDRAGQRSKQRHSDPDQAQQREDRQRDSEQQRSEQQRSGQDESTSRYRISPTGWVRVGTDYDNDGRFDSIDTMYFFDLQRAREDSRRRTQSRRNETGRSDMASDDQARGERSTRTLQGRVQELKEVDLAGVDTTCLIAKLATDQDREVRACLGPRSQLSQLDLHDGDRVTVKGHQGRINDRLMLIAREVRSGDRQVSVDMPSARKLKRIRGDIVSLRKAKFRGFEEPHLVARLELVNGKREMANLGPASELEELDLQEGDEVALLVRPGRINGKSAVIAEQIRAHGTLVELPRPEDTRRFGTRGSTSPERPDTPARRSSDRDRVTYQGQERAALGLTLSETPQQGVEIAKVMPDSPADRSGLQEGDLIVSIDDQDVSSYRDVVKMLRDHEPNERVNIQARRNGRLRDVNVRLSARSSVYDDRN